MDDALNHDRSETAFDDFKAAFTREQALAEANRCLFCADAPCIAACPTGIDIPQFIRKIATDNPTGSARTIFGSNILGASCARVCPVEVLCVGACVFNHMDVPPIQIGRLQRWATDHAIERGLRFFAAGPDSGRSVGLVGGGPASLACAHELRRRGHRCTIYEQRAVLGGLVTTGVAPYKMKADASLAEVEWILGIGGIEVKTGVEVGRDVTLAELERRHDAVFVGVGLGADTRLGQSGEERPGEDLPGVHGAVEWIERMKLGRVPLDGVSHCVVVGGGNTAFDAAREARGLGVPRVTVLYRGSPEQSSGYVHERDAAWVEGVRAEWQAIAIGFVGEGAVAGVRCQRVDARRAPIAGSEFTLDAELVLVAIGQAKLGDLLGGLTGIAVDRGRIVTDAHGATGRAGWFAGGDCTNGGKEVVDAAAEGKRAAVAIDAWLLRGPDA